MGLDIVAFKDVELIKVVKTWEEYEEHQNEETEQVDWVSFYDVSSKIADPIVPGGVYKYQDRHRFCAGSYTGYNNWRNNLSIYALGVEAEKVWKNRSNYNNMPFVELIDFSDCQGVIGTKCCTKLLADFVDHEDKIRNIKDKSDWFMESYDDWKKAFQYGSQNGYILFC